MIGSHVKGEDPAVGMAMAMINFASDPAAAKARLEELAAAEARLGAKQAALKSEREVTTRERVKADQLVKLAEQDRAKVQAELDRVTAARAGVEQERQKLVEKRASLETQLQEYARQQAEVKALGKELAATEQAILDKLTAAENDRTKAQAARNDVEKVRSTTLKQMGLLSALLDEVSEQLVRFREHL